MRTLLARIIAALSVTAALASVAAAQPSAVLDDYVLFAEDWLKVKEVLVPCGDIGVNTSASLLKTSRGITVTTGDCVGNLVRSDGLGSCVQLFSNTALNPFQPPIPFTPPVLSGDLATNCGFPVAFPACDPFTPVTVPAGSVMPLGPGTYGNVTVQGFFDTLNQVAVSGVLQLTGGSYTFCNLKLSRHAQVRAQAPVTVNVNGKLKMQASNYFGPDAGAVASDVVVFVNGTSAKYARSSTVIAELCAPNARCGLPPGGTHLGGVWCDRVKATGTTIGCASPGGAFLD
jgi:hypothetical protein